MLPFKMIPNTSDIPYPLKLYAVGRHHQPFMERAHGYSAHQLFVCKKGKGKFVFSGDQEIELHENDALIVRKHVPHHYFPLNNEDWELAFLCFHETLPFIEFLHLPTEIAFSLSDTAKICEGIEFIWSLDQRDPFSQKQMSSSIYEILLEVHQRTSNLQTSFLDKGPENNIVDQVTTFLNEHYSLSWKVEEIAGQFGYSSQHLNRLFKSYHGRTIHQYLRDIRLERAATLLKRETNVTVEKIAEQIGMDTGYFIRLFQGVHGVTPGVYRNKST